MECAFFVHIHGTCMYVHIHEECFGVTQMSLLSWVSFFFFLIYYHCVFQKGLKLTAILLPTPPMY